MRISDWSSDVCSSELCTAKTTSASPRFTVKYQPIENATLYATGARGFRAGGANAAVPVALGCSLAESAGQIFKPDSVWNYEVGAKVETADRVLTLNGAAYRTEQKGIQLSIPDPCGRSEEHTSELQSLMRISYAVFCLKKKKITKDIHIKSTYTNI